MAIRPLKLLAPARAEREISSQVLDKMGKGRTAVTCSQVPHRSVNIFEDPYVETCASRSSRKYMGGIRVMASWGIQIFTPLLIETTPYRINEGEEEGVICGPKRGEKIRLLPLR